MPGERVLVVDDDSVIRWMLVEALRGWGYEPSEAHTVAGAIAGFESESPAAVLLDIDLPDGSGLEALREIKNRNSHAIVIMVTANVKVDDTIEALRSGAYDFISKPIALNELQVTIRNGIETQKLRREVIKIHRERTKRFSFDQIIGNSPAIQKMVALARKVAVSEVSSVLLQGESGTGKDLVAKAIHYASSRADRPLVAINCAAIPATLIESELFGYEKGAFTDAKARKEGLFEQADGGTLFLDEIGELELSLQAKLLRVLEEGCFRRIGGLKDLPTNAKVIAASNRNLKEESDAGRFRLDLYFRLSVIQIEIPALRDREDDVLSLAGHYIARYNERFGKNIKGLTPAVAEIFCRYPWPGNVRELRNVIERVMILEDDNVITTLWLPEHLTSHPPLQKSAEPTEKPVTAGSTTATINIHSTDNDDLVKMFPLPPDGVNLEEVEMSLVRQAIERSRGNQTQAAKLLRISRDQFRHRLKKLEEQAKNIVEV